MTSMIQVDKVRNQAGTGQSDVIGVARAYAAISAGGTVRAGFNVASVTYAGSGVYSLVFTQAMQTATYTTLCSSSNQTAGTAVMRMNSNGSSEAVATLTGFTYSIVTLAGNAVASDHHIAVFENRT